MFIDADKVINIKKNSTRKENKTSSGSSNFLTKYPLKELYCMWVRMAF